MFFMHFMLINFGTFLLFINLVITNKPEPHVETSFISNESTSPFFCINIILHAQQAHLDFVICDGPVYSDIPVNEVEEPVSLNRLLLLLLLVLVVISLNELQLSEDFVLVCTKFVLILSLLIPLTPEATRFIFLRRFSLKFFGNLY